MLDKNDPALSTSVKPIGPFYSEEEAKAEAEKSGATFKEDAGRGWRKVVASPKPVDIKEINTIRTLLNDGQVVVAAGGGGIPVVRKKQMVAYLVWKLLSIKTLPLNVWLNW